MGSRIVRRLCVLGVLVAVLAVISAGIAPAQQQTARPALDALAAPLYQELAAIRGMPAPGPPPPIEIKSREQTRRFIEQELDRRYSPARVKSERKGMVAWGLIPADYDLRRLFVDLMEEQIAAYYDPRGKVMVVGNWLAPEQQQAALMHELVHALQDREISLDAFIAPHPGQGDQLLARQALIEGEAVALTLELLLKKQGADLAALPDLGPVRQLVAAGSTGAAIAGAPKFLRDLLLFPYVDGLDFVYQFRKRHPWSAMMTLYRDPPRSTTQILNPSKRLGAREDPIPVALPDLSALLPDARVVAEDELGEFALGAVLGQHLGEQAGRRAAAGWRGDHYRICEDRTGRFIIVYLVAMESARVANAFAQTYAKVLEQRHPAVAGKAVAAATPTFVSWQEAGRAFAVDTRAAEVLVLEQVPAPRVDRIRETIWRSRSAVMPTLDRRQRAAVASAHAE
jgi:hypothetical protein